MTVSVYLPVGVWTEVTDADSYFQGIENYELKIHEGATLPTDSSDFKIALPKRIYVFEPVTGNKLYAKCEEHNGTISYELM